MASAMLCPYCEKELNCFKRTATANSFTCKDCKSMFTVKTAWGEAQDALCALIAILTGVIALIAFFGIHSIDDLADSRRGFHTNR